MKKTLTTCRKGDLVVAKQRTSYTYKDYETITHYRWFITRVVHASREGVARNVSYISEDTSASVSNNLREQNIERILTIKPHQKESKLEDLVGESFDTKEELIEAIKERVE